MIAYTAQVHNTVNGQRSWTFRAAESEIPAFATTFTAMDSKGTSPGHMEGSVREVLGEHAFLQNKLIRDRKSVV